MGILKFLGKIGLSCHDIFIVLSLLETLWWVMYTFNDGADAILRLEVQEASKLRYHPFIVVQKIVSFVKLILACGLIWYGTIFAGKAVHFRIYLLSGIVLDTILLLAWICIAIEESWPLVPSNLFGLHYILIFAAFRAGMYYMLYMVCKEIFQSTFGETVVGTVNGTVVMEGLPDREVTTVNSENNLLFLGKGFRAILDYYRMEPEKAFLVCLFWDLLWNLSIVISQEIPEILFDIIFIGLFGSLSLDIPTENFEFRMSRIIIVLVAVYVVYRKILLWMKIWSVAYLVLMIANIGFFCYVITIIVMEETTLAVVIVCTVFFASNATKIIVLFTAARFYFHLKKDTVGFVNENNNE